MRQIWARLWQLQSTGLWAIAFSIATISFNPELDKPRDLEFSNDLQLYISSVTLGIRNIQ